MQKLINLEVRPNGDLRISLTPEGREEMPEMLVGDKSYEAIWADLMEYWQGNSEYRLVAPENVGALTQAPMIGNGYYYNDQGDFVEHPYAKLWWFPQYMVEDELREMMKPDGFVTFTLVVPQPAQELNAPITGANLVSLYYDSYKDFFGSGFHNLLWDVFMKKRFKYTVVAFEPVDAEDGGFEIGIVLANLPGFVRSGVMFAVNPGEYGDHAALLAEINEVVLGVDGDMAYKIVKSSMESTGGEKEPEPEDAGQ